MIVLETNFIESTTKKKRLVSENLLRSVQPVLRQIHNVLQHVNINLRKEDEENKLIYVI